MSGPLTHPRPRNLSGRLCAVAALVALVALSGCATPLQGPLGDRIDAPLSKRWTAALPTDWEGWEVSTTTGCVLAFGWSAPSAPESTRRLECHDPGTGELRWEHTRAVQGGFIQDRLFVEGDRIVLVNNQGAQALDADTGEVRWTFDPSDRVIADSVVKGGRVYLNLDRNVLCVLDLASGGWQRGIRVGGRRLLNVARTAEGEVALLLNEKKDGTRIASRTLVGIDVNGQGGETIEPPWAAMTSRWSQEITTDGFVVEVIDDVVVGTLSKGTLWGLDPSSGEVLYQESMSEQPAVRKPRSVKGARRTATPNELQEIDRLLQTTRLAPDTRLLPGGGQALLAQRSDVGLVMDMVHLERRDPRTLGTLWTLDLGWKEAALVKQELDELGVALLANRKTLAIIDLRTGEVLVERHLNGQGRRYQGISTDGRAVYFVFGLKKKPRLEGHPL